MHELRALPAEHCLFRDKDAGRAELLDRVPDHPERTPAVMRIIQVRGWLVRHADSPPLFRDAKRGTCRVRPAALGRSPVHLTYSNAAVASKHDGYRAQVHLFEGQVRIFTKNGHD
jgi:hypothetical protein